MILLNSLLNFNLPSASKICLSAILAVRPSTSRRKRVFSYVLHIKIENLNHVKFLKIVQILNFAPPFAERRVSSFVRPTKNVCNDWNTKFYSLILIFFMNALICFLKPNLRLHFENSFLQIGEFLIRELRSKRGVSSDHADMNKISGKVFKFCLWNDWIHLKTCSYREFRELYNCSRNALDKNYAIFTFNRCPH